MAEINLPRLRNTYTFPCQAEGCWRRFKVLEELAAHIAERHSSSRCPAKIARNDGFSEERVNARKDHDDQASGNVSSEGTDQACKQDQIQVCQPADEARSSQPAQQPKIDGPKMITCTFKDCEEVFKTQQELVRHKIECSTHFYCETCPATDSDGNILRDEMGKRIRGVDCEDFNDLIRHRVESPKHIACPICGLNHPADQRIECVGCGDSFPRASELMGHIEQGRCRNKKDPTASIKQSDFCDQVNRKTIVKEVLKHHDPGSLFSGSHPSASPSLSNGSAMKQHFPSLSESIQSRSFSQSSQLDTALSDGGVLLDQDDSNPGLKDPLHPTQATGGRATDSSAKHAPNTSKTPWTTSSDHWNSGAPWDASSGTSNVTVKSPGLEVNRSGPKSSRTASNNGWGSNPSWGDDASEANSASNPYASPSASVNGHANNGPRPQPPVNPSTFAQHKRQLDYEFARHQPAPAASQANQTKNTRNAQTGATHSSINIFNQRFYDPSIPGFDAEMFFNTIIEAYVCPHPQCGYQTDTPSGLSAHLQTSHRLTDIRCPSCSKSFNTAQALIAHAESQSRRCQVRYSEQFNEMIDQFSGGFLSVKREKTYRDFGFGETAHPRGGEAGAAKPWGKGRQAQLADQLRGREAKFQAERPPGFS